MEPSLARIGVIYLCRFAEGEHPVRTFVDSYCAHSAGADHDLYVIFKGFRDQSSLAAARALFGGLSVRPIELEDEGYDIGSYFAAARIVANHRLVFFNTFTELLVDNWLKRLDDALSLPGVGLVGATGSWQSHRSMYQAGWRRASYWLRHPLDYVRRNGNAGVPTSHDGNEQESAVSTARPKTRNVFRLLCQFARAAYRVIRFDQLLLPYSPFPNPHIRTNAFMIEKDRFLALKIPSFRSKFSVYKFESGRSSLTCQIIAQGLRAVVVDRKGDVYDPPEWKASSTYWVEDQRNLLAADNRTRQYSEGTSFDRARLQAHAWEDPKLWRG
jgi:hypothetical protein